MTIGPEFAGTAAGTGRRLAAFTIDVLVITAVGLIVGFSTASAALGAVALVQAALALWILEARTGATVGKAMLRLRTARDDRPFSPGAGRTFARGLITALGFAVAAVGAWVVVASSAWDASGRRRSWADRAAQTVVVSVPTRAARAAMPQPAAVESFSRAAAVEHAPAPAGVSIIGVPAVRPAPGQVAVPPGLIQAAPGQVVPASAAAVTAAPRRATVAVEPAYASAAEAQAAPAAGAPAQVPGAEGAEGSLLLIFDTGQREQLPLPVVVNLGRNPSASEPGDRVVTVRDPDSSVSKTHLRLEYARGRAFVTDGGSTNGTEVLGDDGPVRLAPGVRTPLEDGDRVRLGNRTLTLSLLLASDREIH
ncbi:RDD family protein [Agromyces sp. NPDC058136]|uniref:RDD family protein n=1 Tax=Agromyces sp. NPDC058136 TaxID=3346354 RepID=UPI0036DA1E63